MAGNVKRVWLILSEQPSPPKVMLLTIALLGLLYTVGLVVLAGALWRAPEGFEDDSGFHRGQEPRGE
jgi:hypothetical protein